MNRIKGSVIYKYFHIVPFVKTNTCPKAIDLGFRTLPWNRITLFCLSIHIIWWSRCNPHCKDIGFAVNTGKTKYMEAEHIRGMMANEHITIGSNSYENMNTLKYLNSLLTNENSIQEEVNCRRKTGNSCYYSVQTLLSL